MLLCAIMLIFLVLVCIQCRAHALAKTSRGPQNTDEASTSKSQKKATGPKAQGDRGADSAAHRRITQSVNLLALLGKPVIKSNENPQKGKDHWIFMAIVRRGRDHYHNEQGEEPPNDAAHLAARIRLPSSPASNIDLRRRLPLVKGNNSTPYGHCVFRDNSGNEMLDARCQTVFSHGDFMKFIKKHAQHAFTHKDTANSTDHNPRNGFVKFVEKKNFLEFTKIENGNLVDAYDNRTLWSNEHNITVRAYPPNRPSKWIALLYNVGSGGANWESRKLTECTGQLMHNVWELTPGDIRQPEDTVATSHRVAKGSIYSKLEFANNYSDIMISNATGYHSILAKPGEYRRKMTELRANMLGEQQASNNATLLKLKKASKDLHDLDYDGNDTNIPRLDFIYDADRVQVTTDFRSLDNGFAFDWQKELSILRSASELSWTDFNTNLTNRIEGHDLLHERMQRIKHLGAAIIYQRPPIFIASSTCGPGSGYGVFAWAHIPAFYPIGLFTGGVFVEKGDSSSPALGAVPYIASRVIPNNNVVPFPFPRMPPIHAHVAKLIVEQHKKAMWAPWKQQNLSKLLSQLTGDVHPMPSELYSFATVAKVDVRQDYFMINASEAVRGNYQLRANGKYKSLALDPTCNVSMKNPQVYDDIISGQPFCIQNDKPLDTKSPCACTILHNVAPNETISIAAMVELYPNVSFYNMDVDGEPFIATHGYDLFPIVVAMRAILPMEELIVDYRCTTDSSQAHGGKSSTRSPACAENPMAYINAIAHA